MINIAKYPRCDVDQLLAIELPRRRGRLVGQLAPSPLLPPIGRAYAANDDDDDDDDDDEFSLTLSESDDEEDEPERNTEFDGDAIFMTQVGITKFSFLFVFIRTDSICCNCCLRLQR